MDSTQTWTKRSYTCDPDDCDALIEVTTRNDSLWNTKNYRCVCGAKMNLVEEIDATVSVTPKLRYVESESGFDLSYITYVRS